MPILVSICFTTLDQAIVIVGLNFTVLRIIVLLGWARMIIRQEIRRIDINQIDKAVICWLIWGFIAYTLREQTLDAIVNRLGFIYNGFGLYFFFRIVIRDNSDVERVIRAFVLLSIPFAIVLFVEKMTGQNLFSVFGGVPEFSWVRDGAIRAQGPFAHAILAGTFGAVMTPLFLGLFYKQNPEKRYAFAGFVAASITVWCAASSVSYFAYLSGLIGMTMWRLRDKMRLIQFITLIVIASIHIVMKAPVWYLLARAGEVVGGTGWHRAYLIDQAIVYFDEWWLVGTAYTAHWFPYGLPTYPNQTDITNQFILQGIDGGLLTMMLFLVILILCFKKVGNSVKEEEGQLPESKMMIWSMGACLFVMVVSFMGVTYFDQMIVVWYLLISMISLIAKDSTQAKPE